MENLTSDIRLFDSHHPALTEGYYKISIDQKFSVDHNTPENYATRIDFNVAGERYSLDPTQVDSVFPPAGAMGDFSTILPHLCLNRSTLPWERTGNTPDSIPWLGLLLFTNEEINNPAQFMLESMSISAWEGGTTDDDVNADPISVIRLSRTLLDSILPTYTEVRYLAHVKGEAGKEKAVIIGSRMPVKDTKNTVHLVSFEDRYVNGIFDKSKLEFVSLKSWDFFCNDHFIITKEIVKTCVNEDIKAALYALVDKQYFKREDFLAAIQSQTQLSDGDKKDLLTKFEVAHLPSILKHLNRTPATLRLSETDGLPNLDHIPTSYIAAGYVPVSYQLKNGCDTIPAVYRGPLIPVSSEVPDENLTKVPLRFSDDLFRFIEKNESTKTKESVDISYSSAWELGKALALKDKNFSITLFQWKRTCYQLKKNRTNNSSTGHIVSLAPLTFPAMPVSVRNWLKDLTSLKNIPFNYLVPLEAMLPFESIRFFTVDQTWIRYLVDGAFSIARISATDSETDGDLAARENLYAMSTIKSGFFLRSRAVSGWPALLIDGKGTVENPLAREIAQTKLSPTLLVCFANYLLEDITIYQKPESVHFGFGDRDVSYSSTNKVKVDIDSLYGTGTNAMSNVATFTASLIERTEKVTFTIS